MKNKLIKVDAIQLDGTKKSYLCNRDSDGNLWVPKTGFCFVPKNGNEREARENSIQFATGEGINFFIVK